MMVMAQKRWSEGSARRCVSSSSELTMGLATSPVLLLLLLACWCWLLLLPIITSA